MKHFRKLTGPYFAWLVLFVLIPLVLIAIYAFTTSGNPVKTLNFTLMNFAKINEPTYIKVFIKSIEMGVLTTGVCLILGYPMAYLIAKCPEEMQDMLIMAVFSSGVNKAHLAPASTAMLDMVIRLATDILSTVLPKNSRAL